MFKKSVLKAMVLLLFVALAGAALPVQHSPFRPPAAPQEQPAGSGGAETGPENRQDPAGGSGGKTAPENRQAPAGSESGTSPGGAGQAPAGAEGGNSGPETARQGSSSGGTGSLRGQIEEKYLSRLQSLASGYESRLNGLASAASSELAAAKKADPNADLNPIINKYYAAGKALEAECDSQFYSILAEFESELSAHSLPLDTAVRAREAYEARKGARAGQLLSGGL
ncbi:hypothetical membrane protein [Pelotomaculum thermopropionicum SI]|uniref:Hypothetical membrane protein n=1 Tax=Pelotomaculum thermopropionicum (strain DSM 13744 / JCM 10971 / SI) TaxID=370438 RepID=A5D569_PELTS|nr:hypothetical membrane protein [Pelotomaculum thermopropionicum SI]